MAPFSPGGPGIPSCPWFPLGPAGPGSPGAPLFPKKYDASCNLKQNQKLSYIIFVDGAL